MLFLDNKSFKLNTKNKTIVVSSFKVFIYCLSEKRNVTNYINVFLKYFIYNNALDFYEYTLYLYNAI